jgi:hypothetical protein
MLEKVVRTIDSETVVEPFSPPQKRARRREIGAILYLFRVLAQSEIASDKRIYQHLSEPERPGSPAERTFAIARLCVHCVPKSQHGLKLICQFISHCITIGHLLILETSL